MLYGRNRRLSVGSKIDQAIWDAGDINEESARAIIKLRRAFRVSVFLLVAVSTTFGLCAYKFGGAAAPTPSAAPKREQLTRAELIEWATAKSASTSDRLVEYFDACRAMRVEEAIPFAALHARLASEEDGKTRWHVIAARNFLRGFSDETIEYCLREEMKSHPESAPAYVRRLTELIR